MKGIFSKIMILLGVLSLVLGTFTGFGSNMVYAQDLELIGKEIGLEVTPNNTRLFDLTNLNPGDTEEAEIDIRNQYTSAFLLSMRAERLSEAPEEGQVDLFEQLIITIYLDGEEIYTGPMKDFATSNIDLGNFNPNNQKSLKAVVHLPGPGTGNEFQGASVDVKWIFIATAEEQEPPRDPTGPTDPGGPTVFPDPEPEPDEPETPEESEEIEDDEIIEIIEDEVPRGQGEIPEEEIEEIVEIEGEVPKGIPRLPKTGEIPTVVYYTLGTILLGLGIGTGSKKKK